MSSVTEQRLAAAQLVVAFGTEADKYDLVRLVSGQLDDAAAARVRGRLDSIAGRVFCGQAAEWREE